MQLAIVGIVFALIVAADLRFSWAKKRGEEWLFRAWRYCNHRAREVGEEWAYGIDERRTQYSVQPRRWSYRLRFWDWSERGAAVDIERYNEVVEWEKSQGYICER